MQKSYKYILVKNNLIMEATKDFLDSLLKKSPSPAKTDNPTNTANEIKPESTSKEASNSEIFVKPPEKNEEPITKSIPIEKEENSKIQSNNDNNIINKESNPKEQDKVIDKEQNKESMSPEPQEKGSIISKEDNKNAISSIKEESKENENDKDKEKEKAKEPNQKSSKEIPKEDYKFPIPSATATAKMEESKNSDPSYFLFKFPQAQNNFNSLNVNLQENLRPRNKDSQPQVPHLFQNYNISFFNPITFSCSLNTHSVRNSKIKPIQKEEEFLEKIIKIGDVSNINEFWEVFQHLKKPNQCPVGSDYHVFKRGIVPMWEDKLNKDGGKLSLLLTWKYVNVIWEEVTFNFAKGLLPYYDYINGIVISVRPKFFALSFWIKCGNNSMVEKIRNALTGLLQAPSTNCFDFIPFN